MQTVPVDTCFHPIRVPRGDGFSYFPCGSCPACRKSFHAKWRARLESAINTHASTLFVTLTYDNDHLPLCEIDPTTGDVVSVTHTRFKRGLSKDFERVDVTDSFLDINPTFPYIFNDLNINDLPHFVLSRHGDDVDFDTTPRFAVCLRKDIQDFIKRLRVALYRDSSLVGRDISFTYFICSEYGPDTFRPHYHGLLFFNDSYTASVCHSYYVNDCWRKSSLSEAALAKQCQYVSFGQGASSYASKYVTCDDVLPVFLSNRFFKPFHLSSHSVPIGSEALPLPLVSHTVRETDLLHAKTIKDKDTGEFVTVRLPYPSSFWARFFPQFLFGRLLSLSTIRQLYTRIFALPLYDEAGKPFPCPNRIDEFNSLFHIGEVRHTSPAVYKLRCRESTLIWHKLGAVRPFDRVFYGHPSSDIIYTVTYSDVLPELVKHFDFIDLFLFGIPQNRTVVNKILKLRRALLDTDDNWCSSASDYMYHLNLYQSKCFTNCLKQQYDNLSSNHPGTSFSPELVAEYYPSFYKSLPTDINALTPDIYERLDNILWHGFSLSITDFYNDGKLLHFDFYDDRRYVYYRYQVANYYRDFTTKRKSYQRRYGNGEIDTHSP